MGGQSKRGMKQTLSSLSLKNLWSIKEMSRRLGSNARSDLMEIINMWEEEEVTEFTEMKTICLGGRKS